MATAPKPKTKSDNRLRATSDDARAPRSATADASRTQLDGTAHSSAERLQMLRSEFTQEALPRAPLIPGFHVCWLSTTSSYDPIQKRVRIGYEPVRAEEVPGFNPDKMSSGERDGVISCNEMVLFKIPEELYQEVMREFHHNMPQQEEQSIKDGLKRGIKDSEGKELDEIEGFEDLAQKRPVQTFA